MALLNRVPLKQRLSERVLAYVAGLIEGDGSISCSTTSSGCTLDVVVTNGNLRLLDWLHNRVGGRVGEKKPCGQLGSGQQYQWSLKQADAARFCSWILPFLVGKRRQAELVIEAGEIKRGWRPGQGRYPALIRKRLQEIGGECSWCNKRGWRGENNPYSDLTELPGQAKLELVS